MAFSSTHSDVDRGSATGLHQHVFRNWATVCIVETSNNPVMLLQANSVKKAVSEPLSLRGGEETMQMSFPLYLNKDYFLCKQHSQTFINIIINY